MGLCRMLVSVALTLGLILRGAIGFHLRARYRHIVRYSRSVYVARPLFGWVGPSITGLGRMATPAPAFLIRQRRVQLSLALSGSCA